MRKSVVSLLAAIMALCVLAAAPAFAGEIAILKGLNESGANVVPMSDIQLNDVRAKGVTYQLTMSNPDLNYWYIFHDGSNNDAVVYEAYWTGVQGIYSQSNNNGNIDYYYDRNTSTQIFRVDWNTSSMHINYGTNKVIDWSSSSLFGQFKGFVGISGYGYFYGLPKPPYGSTLHVRI